MRKLGPAVMLPTLLLLAACGDDTEAPATSAVPVAATVPAQAPAPPPPAPAAGAGQVPLRQTPGGLLGFPVATANVPGAPRGAPGVRQAPPAEPPEDAPPSEAEVRALYEGIMYTYAFDACGLPLIGEMARHDIEQKIEICPNPPLRKDAFRMVYHRAQDVAQQDPEKMRASAGRACPDKREFLRRVMSHAEELQFDDNQPPDCGLLSSPPPGNPTADGAGPMKGQKPF